MCLCMYECGGSIVASVSLRVVEAARKITFFVSFHIISLLKTLVVIKCCCCCCFLKQVIVCIYK